MELSDARRLQRLEDENAKLKRLVADTMLDVVTVRRERLDGHADIRKQMHEIAANRREGADRDHA